MRQPFFIRAYRQKNIYVFYSMLTYFIIVIQDPALQADAFLRACAELTRTGARVDFGTSLSRGSRRLALRILK